MGAQVDIAFKAPSRMSANVSRNLQDVMMTISSAYATTFRPLSLRPLRAAITASNTVFLKSPSIFKKVARVYSWKDRYLSICWTTECSAESSVLIKNEERLMGLKLFALQCFVFPAFGDENNYYFLLWYWNKGFSKHSEQLLISVAEYVPRVLEHSWIYIIQACRFGWTETIDSPFHLFWFSGCLYFAIQ